MSSPGESRIHPGERSRNALLVAPREPASQALRRWLGGAGFSTRTPEPGRPLLDDADDLNLVVADLPLLNPEQRRQLRILDSRPTPVLAVPLPIPLSTGPARDRDEPPPGLSRLGEIRGRTLPMQTVYDEILRVAGTEATVFLVGESGTGKDLAAKTLHRLSHRSAGPFVPLNCGAIPAGLIEAEIFGHEKGSFTGASHRRRGLFEEADGGTLFLDEITEMPVDLQVKLLRVLESGTVRPIGGQEGTQVDVRLIAATNRDPAAAVEQGLLREDLYYRLMVFPIVMPPLRERLEDIEALSRSFLDRLNRMEEGKGKTISESALARLSSYSWPGNVRELKNALERAYILADEEITAADLQIDAPELLFEAPADRLGIRIGTSIAEAERRLILATLEHLDGNKSRAAKVLGISVRTIYNRLNVYHNAAR
jgi:two-component system response regulator AtoC